MHAFLKRHYRKNKKTRKKKQEGEEGEGESEGESFRGVVSSSHQDLHDGSGVLQYQDAVSKSMDSLLMLVSSVPLPPNSTIHHHHAPTSSSSSSNKKNKAQTSRGAKKRRRKTDPKAAGIMGANNSPDTSSQSSSIRRRHSFDLATGKVTEDEEEEEDEEYEAEEEEEGDHSDSVESSPPRRAVPRTSTGSRSDSAGSQDTGATAWAQHKDSGPMMSSPLLTSTTTASDRGWSDSEEDPQHSEGVVSPHPSNISNINNSNINSSINDASAGAHHASPPTWLMFGDANAVEEEGEGEEANHRITLPSSSSPSPPRHHNHHHHRRAKEERKNKQKQLMEHPFFLLEVRLLDGRDLVVRDSCGTSDPYVKFKLGGKQVYKSRTIHKNLNPRWDENFTIPLEDVHKPLQVKVFDYDRGLHDDPMGNAEIDISQLELGKEMDLKLLLNDRGKTDYMGYLNLTCTLMPKTQEDKEQFMARGSTRALTDAATASSKKFRSQWSGVVTIVLVEGVDLVPMDDNGLSDPYVKFRMGHEKYRSKHKAKTLSPKWLEQFDLRMFNDQPSQLEINVYDYDARGRDDFMGRASVDLSNLESELTHTLEVELEDGAGMIKLLLTISGMSSTDATSDLCNYTPNAQHQGQLTRKYSILKLSDMTDVGHLQVKVFKACGLKSADIGGNSDPFCVLELVNSRVQTHTEYKTLNPEWNKVFSFKVRDIHSNLEVTIFDEDRDKKVEFLGKVIIPLLRIRSGERKWYALKDKKLRGRSKGAILLELDLIFNHVKAAVRTLTPAEEKFMEVEPKFKIQLMKKNIDRVGQLLSTLIETGKFLQSCFNWDSTPRSATAFVVFLVMVWNFEIYMLPITLLLIFLRNLLIAQLLGAFKRDQAEEDYHLEEDEEEDEEKEREEKKTFKEKLLSIQDVCLQVQQSMDMVASMGERVKNTFNWTVPWLSALAVVGLSALVIILYFIPLRWLILALGIKKFVKKGIHKFTRKLRQPNVIDNNELLDFLSRVPSDREVAQYREFRPELSPALHKKKRT